MDFLPEELIIEIFSYLQPPDLISLSLTCKSFNNLIDTTKLHKKFTIHFPNKKFKNFWQTNRKYEKIQITTDGNPQTLIPSASFNANVRKLTITSASITGDILSQMLELCVNLEVARFDNINYYGDKYFPKICDDEVPKLRNLQLEMIQTDFEILKIFEFCQVTKVLIEGYKQNVEEGNLKALEEFFNNQPDLKELTVQKVTQNFFPQNRFKNLCFKLQKLTIREVLVQKDENFGKFLSNFFDSLKTFEIERTVIHNLGDLLKKFKNLKELKLDLEDKVMRTLPKLEKVERLTVSRKRMPKRWLEKYPNLKKLKLNNVKYISN